MGCTSSTIGTTPRVAFTELESGLSDQWLLSTIRNGVRDGNEDFAKRLSGVESWTEVLAENAAGIEKKDGGGASGSLLKRITLKYKEGKKLPTDPDTIIFKYVDSTTVAPLDVGMRLLLTLIGGSSYFFDLLSRSPHWYYNDFKPMDNRSVYYFFFLSKVAQKITSFPHTVFHSFTHFVSTNRLVQCSFGPGTNYYCSLALAVATVIRSATPASWQTPPIQAAAATCAAMFVPKRRCSFCWKI